MTKLRALQPYLDQQLPNDWELIPLSQIIDLAYGEGLSDENRVAGNIPVFGSNGIVGYHNNSIVKGPAIIVGRKGSAGEVTWSDFDCFPIDTTFYVRPLTDDLDFRWLYYQLVFVDFKRLNAATGVPGLSRSDALDICIPFYNKTEQSKISEVLQQVDYAIEHIQNSIAQAQQLKKALMQNLLSGRLKPDGTWRTPDEFYVDEKFGRVPKGWRVKSSNDIFFINKETLSAKTPDDYEFNYITIEAVTTEEIQWEAITRCVFKDAPSRARRVLSSGDILLSTVRPNLKSFAIFYAPNEEKWICSTGFSVFTPKPNQDRDFYFYQILGEIGEKQFYSYVAGTNYPAVNDRDMRKLRLLEAPYPEQKEISKILSQISQSIIMKKNKIKVLQTLRKSLMQNLLTGKIRVQAN